MPLIWLFVTSKPYIHIKYVLRIRNVMARTIDTYSRHTLSILRYQFRTLSPLPQFYLSSASVRQAADERNWFKPNAFLNSFVMCLRINIVHIGYRTSIEFLFSFVMFIDGVAVVFVNFWYYTLCRTIYYVSWPKYGRSMLSRICKLHLIISHTATSKVTSVANPNRILLKYSPKNFA